MVRSGWLWEVNQELAESLPAQLSSLKKEMRAALPPVPFKCGLYLRANELFLYCEAHQVSGDVQDALLRLRKALDGFAIGAGVALDEVFYAQGSLAGTSFERVATYMKVKPGFEEPYRQAHAHIWPSILEGIVRTKIRSYSIFMKETHLYSFFEVHNLNQAMAVLSQDSENQRWQRTMAPMMDVSSGMSDGSSVYLQEIMFLQNR